MRRSLCIFEDKKTKNFYPLTLTRPVFDLRCGITTLYEKLIKRNGEEVYLVCREYLREVISQKLRRARVNKLEELKMRDLFFVNGRVLSFEDEIGLEGDEEIGISGEDIIYARLNQGTLKSLSFVHPEEIEEVLNRAKEKVKVREVKAKIARYLWDLVNWNGEAIEEDFKEKGKVGVEGEVKEGVYLISPEKIYIGKGTKIEPGVILNAAGGCIYIEEEVRIRPPTIIDGPCYIGKGTVVDGAKIREGCSVGPVCRIAGEIEESIFYAYTNKHHDGFIGHAYIGEWVNLGALTTNSDLKNTYGNVKVYVGGKNLDTKEMKVGSFIGDHTKTGIGTLLNTGCVIGVASNLFGGGVTPKFVPSFSWGGKNFSENKLSKVIEVARVVMRRRDVVQTEADRALLRKVYELTKKEREEFLSSEYKLE
ncbi:hypothetical protein J7K28_06905 [Candidatus Aerophobetes bacterium]|nr:hypothetical protein [Candidatus Aerophobetes bacterium]